MGTETFKGLDNRCLVLEDQVLPTAPHPPPAPMRTPSGWALCDSRFLPAPRLPK